MEKDGLADCPTEGQKTAEVIAELMATITWMSHDLADKFEESMRAERKRVRLLVEACTVISNKQEKEKRDA